MDARFGVSWGASQLADLERVQIGFLKVLLGVQNHTSTLYVLAEFGRYPLKLAWQAQAAKYLSRLESMDANKDPQTGICC